MLVSAGIPPCCGAALPDGPKTQDSQCAASGLMVFASANGASLHLDHEPPLRPEERGDTVAVTDENRIQLLCSLCHAAKPTGHGQYPRGANRK